MRQEGKSVIFKDIEMGPTAFERESFVPVCTSITFVCISKGSEIQRVSVFAQPLYSISYKVIEIQTGTNDSLSNAVGLIANGIVYKISIFSKWGANLTPAYGFSRFRNLYKRRPTLKIQTDQKSVKRAFSPFYIFFLKRY